MAQPVLADRYLLLSYHRAGFGRSSPIEGSVSIADHARHCVLLMRQLGIERAHVVGHSSSAVIALELALEFSDAVHSLALMEPARPNPQTELQDAFRRDVVEAAVERYRAGDKAGAVDTWARGVFGPDYRDPLERGLPRAIEQCIADADAFFAQELPALQTWSFTHEDASRITQPAVGIRGENTAAAFPQRLELLGSWLPNLERFELPGTTHLLHLQSSLRCLCGGTAACPRRTRRGARDTRHVDPTWSRRRGPGARRVGPRSPQGREGRPD
jgi:pimeloyl-ACP methyl ester carboxylesterase